MISSTGFDFCFLHKVIFLMMKSIASVEENPEKVNIIECNYDRWRRETEETFHLLGSVKLI